MKLRMMFVLLVFLVSFNALFYVISANNANERINIVLKERLQSLKTHYEILLETQKNTALAIDSITVNSPEVISILSKAVDATKEERVILREELQKKLTPIYNAAKIGGVLQYQFVFPNNISFLRMHKPNKFGDDLTNIREDFKYVNETLKPTQGFVQGRVAHGFRNTFPLFSPSGKHLGALEVSFSSERFQWFLNNISHIHTHFLVNNKIFDVKYWKRDDAFLQYSPSAESKKYMIALPRIHSKELCIDKNIQRFLPVKEELDTKIQNGAPFSLYFENNSYADVVSFLPIKNLKKTKVIAWLVSYEKSKFIQLTLRSMLIIRILVLLFSLILLYFIVQLILSKAKIEKSNVKLKDMALYDPLTGLRNRLFLKSDVEKVIFHHKEHHSPYATLMFDIDWFKEVNDTYGHDMGDVVLKELASILKNTVREEDRVYRVGGEEFVILLNRISYKHTVQLAEKIRVLIKSHTFKVSDEEFSRTISCGLYHSSLFDAKDAQIVLKLIDNALYESKKSGRNRITNASPIKEQ